MTRDQLRQKAERELQALQRLITRSLATMTAVEVRRLENALALAQRRVRKYRQEGGGSGVDGR